jgi:hypothetical protein
MALALVKINPRRNDSDRSTRCSCGARYCLKRSEFMIGGHHRIGHRAHDYWYGQSPAQLFASIRRSSPRLQRRQLVCNRAVYLRCRQRHQIASASASWRRGWPHQAPPLHAVASAAPNHCGRNSALIHPTPTCVARFMSQIRDERPQVFAKM